MAPAATRPNAALAASRPPIVRTTRPSAPPSILAAMAASRAMTPSRQPAQARRYAGPVGLAGRINLTLPLATLLGMSGAPGEVSGFGPVDAATAIDLAALLAGHPSTNWCVTLTGPNGRAICHGCAIPPDRARAPADRAGAPGGTRLDHCSGSAGRGGGDPGGGGGDRGRSGLPRRWHLAFNMEPLAVRTCTHEREVPGYSPPRSLRHLIEIRDTCCSHPTCRRPAAQCDHDHTIPYAKGGRTCECNIGPSAGITTGASRPKAGGWHSPNPVCWSGARRPGALTPAPPPSIRRSCPAGNGRPPGGPPCYARPCSAPGGGGADGGRSRRRDGRRRGGS